MKIVLISGKQGSGKTTLQKALQDEWRSRGYASHVLNFADVIYSMHYAVLNILNQYWPDRKIVKDGPLLQLLGTDWGRKTIDDNIWVKILKHKLSTFSPSSRSLIIVGDCRFKNELDGIEALKIRLECDRESRKKRCEAWRENEQHPSEIDLDDYVHIPGKFDLIFNTGTQSVEHCLRVTLGKLATMKVN